MKTVTGLQVSILVIILAAVLFAGCGRIRVDTGSHDLFDRGSNDLSDNSHEPALSDPISPYDAKEEWVGEDPETEESEQTDAEQTDAAENIADAEPEPEDYEEEAEGSEYIGVMPRTYLPEGIKDFGGWMAGYDNVDAKYICGHYSKDGAEMIWLEELLYRDEDGTAQTVVVDVLMLPEIQGGYLCSSMYYDNEYAFGLAFGMVAYSDDEFLTDVYRVWVVDEEIGKFVEVPSEGWIGYNEGYGV